MSLTTKFSLGAALAAAALAVAGPPAHAQIEWDAFLDGGYSRGNLTAGSDNLLGTDIRNGFTTGVSAQLSIQDTYVFEIGMRYTRKGGGGEIDSTFAVENLTDVPTVVGGVDIALDYVEIPLTAGVRYDTSEHGYVRGYLGPVMNILTRARAAGDVEGRHFDQDLKDSMKSVMWEGTVGAGYVYEFDRFSVTAGVRFSQGLAQATNGPDIKPRTFTATIGVGIPLVSSLDVEQ